MGISRRDFLKLGAASAGMLALESQFQVFTRLTGAELEQVGKGVSHIGTVRKAIPGTCLMCGVTDGIIGYVEDGRLVKIEGNPKHPNTRGRICAKGQAGIKVLYDPYRIKWPMKRVGKRGEDKWERISYEEAIDIVANRIKKILAEGEPGRIAVHHGRDRDKTIRKRFELALGTKHGFTHTSICEASMKVGYETSFGQDIDVADPAHTDYMIHFGDNIYEASYMMNPLSQRIVEGRVDRRAKMVVFDPRLSVTAGRADEWFPIRPGADGAVALAMANVITGKGLANEGFIDKWCVVEKTPTGRPSEVLARHLSQYTPEWASRISGIPAKDIERIAIEFASAAPRCYARCYNGLSNHRNGAMNARCIAMLNAIVGNIDKKGGFCLVKGGGVAEPGPHPPKPKGEFPIAELDHKWYPLASHHAYHLLPHYLKETGYQLRLYMIHMYNPLYVNPEQPLWWEVLSDPRYVEFIVDFSPFWSETAKEVADLVIPETTYLERFAVSAMPPVENFPFLQLYQPIVEPLYGLKSIYEIYFDIARKVGGEVAKYFDFPSIEDYERRVVEGKWGEGSWEILKRDGVIIPKQPDGRYKGFDGLTPEEVDSMRIYESYAKRLKPEELMDLKARGAVFPKGDGAILDKEGKETKGVIIAGVAYKGFPTGKHQKPTGRFNIYSEEWERHGFPGLPTYMPIPRLESKKEDEHILITGKVNVHTQSRTANASWLMEVFHYNPAWINPVTAEKRGIKDGDRVIIESSYGAKKMECRAYLTEGINPECIFISTSLGHWAYGELASKGRPDPDNPEKEIWYKRMRHPGDNMGKSWHGKETQGWNPNAILPDDREATDPAGGEYGWCDTPVRVYKA